MTIRAKAIDQFIGYFQSKIDSIEAVQTTMYRKLLYATALEPLARAALGNIGHRKRIVRLIDDLTQWTEKDLVSLPQAEMKLREKN